MNTSTYLGIWVWLMGLLIASAAISFLPISRGAAAALILSLSTVKAVLVALYYMHLKFDRPWLLAVVLFPFAIILLALLLVWSSRLVSL